MAISNSYPSGIPIEDPDLFVGTKAANNRTVNYTAQGIANYLNINSKVAIGGQMSFQFTVTPNIPKTIAFDGGSGNNTTFSSINKLIVSAIDVSTANITIFLNYLNNSQVLLSEQNQPNFFGHYKITGYTQIGISAFYELDLEFIGGNGTIIDKQYYDLISFVLSSQIATPDLQQVTDAGAITTDTITVGGITSGNLYSDGYNFGISDNYDTNYNMLYQPFVGLQITNNSDYVYLYQDASIGFQTVAGDGNLRSDLLTSTRSWQFPDASGTLALLSNIPIIPTVGTWGALNYPTWTTGTPFVKMTAAGTFALDTNTYLTSAVTAVTATSPITSSGGATPDISTSMATNKLIGRSTAGVGVMEEITIGTGLTLSGGTLNASAAGVTSVGLTMPSAFTVTNSPITSSGDIAVTGAGLVSQYVRGDGTLANFPNSTGGGSSVNYYLNGSVSQGTFGGDTYYEMSKTPILGAGTNFTRTNGQGNGYIASFITDAGDPSFLNIPAGNWNVEFYFQSSSTGGSPQFYGEIYKVSATNVFTLVASGVSNPEGITNGTTVDQYFTSIPVPQTSLLITDRLAIRIYVITSGRTITLHTENGNLCEVLTTFTTGITALNGLTTQVQNLAVGTSGTDFAISSATDTHTFNLPDASATARGVITTGTQTINGQKTFSPNVTAASAIAKGTVLTPTLVASANSDTLVGLDIAPTFTNGAFTGVNNFGIRVASNTGIQSSIITGFNNLRLTTVGISSNIAFSLNQTSLEIARFHGTTGNLQLQNGGTFTDIASSRLTVNSTTQGFLPPRMTTTQRNAIASPATGLLVYDTTLLSEFQYNGTAWVSNTLGYTPYRFTKPTEIVHTGVLTETILQTILIPANTFTNGDFIMFSALVSKLANIGNTTHNLKINTTNTLVGATSITLLGFNTVNFSMKFKREMIVNSGNIYVLNVSAATTNDQVTNATASVINSYTYNLAADMYFFVTCTLGNILDTITYRGINFYKQ